MPNWTVKISKKVEKALDRIPVKDQRLILSALDNMALYPFNGDVIHLQAERSEWRRRVGNYRIFFDVYEYIRVVEIVEIARRTSNMY